MPKVKVDICDTGARYTYLRVWIDGDALPSLLRVPNRAADNFIARLYQPVNSARVQWVREDRAKGVTSWGGEHADKD